MAGKGSKPRPMNGEMFRQNFDEIFGHIKVGDTVVVTSPFSQFRGKRLKVLSVPSSERNTYGLDWKGTSLAFDYFEIRKV